MKVREVSGYRPSQQIFQAMRERRQVDRRVGLYLLASSGGLFIVAWLVGAFLGPGGVVVSLLLFGTVLACGAGIAVLFWPLLLRGQYWKWLLWLKPHQPWTFWGQVLQQGVNYAGACVAVVAGAVLSWTFAGAPSGQVPAAEMISAAWMVFVLFLVIGLTYWVWTRTVVRLAVAHFWGVRMGEIPPMGESAESKFALVVGGFSIWAVGALALAFAFAAVYELLPAAAL